MTTANHVWVVEQFYNNKWEPVGLFMTEDEETGEPILEAGVGSKRSYARDVARRIRKKSGREVRVIPYTSNFDLMGRVNRQVKGERR